MLNGLGSLNEWPQLHNKTRRLNLIIILSSVAEECLIVYKTVLLGL